MPEPRRSPTSRTYRRCQECGGVCPVRALRRVNDYGEAGPARGGWKLRCPACGCTAPTWAFVPTDPPAGPSGA